MGLPVCKAVPGITDLESILGLPVCKAVPGITDLQVILRLPVCKVVPGITDLEAILRLPVCKAAPEVTDLESFLGLPVCKAVSGKCFIVKCRRNQYRRNPRWKILYFDSAITIPEYGGIRLLFQPFQPSCSKSFIWDILLWYNGSRKKPINFCSYIVGGEQLV